MFMWQTFIQSLIFVISNIKTGNYQHGWFNFYSEWDVKCHSQDVFTLELPSFHVWLKVIKKKKNLYELLENDEDNFDATQSSSILIIIFFLRALSKTVKE